MQRIATFNINGIRAAHKRGFGDWLAHRGADVVALQEVRCPIDALPEGAFGDFHVVYEPGELAGRNGVAILTRQAVSAVRTWGADVWLASAGETGTLVAGHDPGAIARGLGKFAREGRYIEVDLAGTPITVASLYLPKGGLPAHLQKPGRMREAPDGGAKYQRKMDFLAAFARQLDRSRRAAKAQGREFLLLGDLNIAHQEHDLTNWRTNKQTEGFLPEEREWFGAQLGPRRLIDVQRKLVGEVSGPMSWWSWMGQAFEKDVGWRIDYHLATPDLAKSAVQAVTDRAASREERISDHTAVVIDYNM